MRRTTNRRNYELLKEYGEERFARRIAEPDAASGFLLDGYPRTVAQVEELDGMVAFTGHRLDAVVALTVDEDAVVQRLLLRAETDGRADDTEDVIRRRMQVYAEQTEPLVEHYRAALTLMEQAGWVRGQAAVLGNLVYFGTGDGHIIARNADNGTARWSSPARCSAATRSSRWSKSMTSTKRSVSVVNRWKVSSTSCATTSRSISTQAATT